MEPLTDSFAKLASGLWLEGLAIDYRRNIVWYSDVIGGGVHGLMPDGRIESINPSRKWTAGLLVNEDGAVLSSGAGGILWNNVETGRSGWLLDQIDGKPINGINEMTADGAGGICFGTCDLEMIQRGQRTRPSALYRLTVDRELVKLAEDIRFANGLALSPTCQQLYCNDTFVGTYAFDVQTDFRLANKRLLLEKKDCDGMAVDSDGNLWITGFQSNHVVRIRPDGTQLPSANAPAEAITQVRFAGADMRDVYMTAVSPEGGESLKNGVHPTEPISFLYRGHSKISGLPIPPVRFRLG